MKKQGKIIPHEHSLREITLRGMLIALVLVMLLAASNIYLGLQAGLTVSASIPAAILSMGILRWFKGYNILENNIVQTCVSAGEGCAASIIFSLPALLILHYWTHFNYFETVIITLLGCLMGVLFSIPLRRILLADQTLRFPEGVAIAKVLQSVHDKDDASFKFLVKGAGLGGLISFFQQGLQIAKDSAGLWFSKGNVLFGLSLGFSPALIAAGYIIGITAAMSMLIGIILTWVIGIPLLSAHYGFSGQGINAAMNIWSHYIRYIGVGTLLTGGIWTIFNLIKPVAQGLYHAIVSLKINKGIAEIRTERDIKINIVGIMIVILILPILAFTAYLIHQANLGLSTEMTILFFIVLSLIVLIFQFIISAVCAYLSGLVGASSNPLSAFAISAAIMIGVIILAFMPMASIDHNLSFRLAGLMVIVLTLTTAVGGIATDTMQDLKAGQLVGATPWKQQVMLFLGVTVTAFMMPLILNLLLNAYGIGGVFPYLNMDHAHGLPAPQATLMASVVQGVFSHDLNWPMIFIGVSIAIICIIIDNIISRKNYRLHALAVGLAVYLPVMTSSCLVIGGFMSYFIDKKLAVRNKNSEEHQVTRQHTMVAACGMLAGSTIMGVILAVPFVIYKSSDALAIMPASWSGLAGIIGLLSAMSILYYFYKMAIK